MAKLSWEDSRIRDGVRDSKIRSDIQLYSRQKLASFTYEMNQAATGINYDTEHDTFWSGRVVPRTTTREVGGTGFGRTGLYPFTAGEYRRRLVREANKRWGSCNGYPKRDRILFEHQGQRGCTLTGSYSFKFVDELPTFNGSSLMLDLFDWGDTIEEYFEEMNPPDSLKCKIAASRLRGIARLWWKGLQDDRLMEGKDPIASWPIMRKLLISRFQPIACSAKCPSQVYNGRQAIEDRVKEMKDESFMPANCSSICPLQSIKAKQDKNDAGGSTKMADSFMPKKCLTEVPCDINKQGAISDLIALSESEIIYESSDIVNSEKSESLKSSIERPIGNFQLEGEFHSPELLNCVDGCEDKRKTEQTLRGEAGSTMVKGPGKEAVYNKLLKIKDPPLNEQLATEVVEYSVQTGVSCDKDRKPMVRSDDWKTYGYSSTDRRLNLKMLSEILHMNFDPGGMSKNGQNEADGQRQSKFMVCFVLKFWLIVNVYSHPFNISVKLCPSRYYRDFDFGLIAGSVHMKYKSSDEAKCGFVWFCCIAVKHIFSTCMNGQKPCVTMKSKEKDLVTEMILLPVDILAPKVLADMQMGRCNSIDATHRMFNEGFYRVENIQHGLQPLNSGLSSHVYLSFDPGGITYPSKTRNSFYISWEDLRSAKSTKIHVPAPLTLAHLCLQNAEKASHVLLGYTLVSRLKQIRFNLLLYVKEVNSLKDVLGMLDTCSGGIDFVKGPKARPMQYTYGFGSLGYMKYTSNVGHRLLTKSTPVNASFFEIFVRPIRRWLGLPCASLLQQKVRKIVDSNVRNRFIDRHEDGWTVLTLIHHVYCVPEVFEDCTREWLCWLQARKPFNLNFVGYIRLLKDAEDIASLKFTVQYFERARLFNASTVFLKHGAERGLAPFDLSSIMSKGKMKIESEIGKFGDWSHSLCVLLGEIFPMACVRKSSYLKLGEGMDCATGLGKMKETDVLCGVGLLGEVHGILIYKPCEEVLFQPWDYTFRIARGRAFPLEGWNDEYDPDIEGKFIITKLRVITIYSYLNVWCKNGQPMECLKLFHDVVNGLDPPIDVDGKLSRSLNVDSYDFARGRAFCIGGWTDVGTPKLDLSYLVF